MEPEPPNHQVVYSEAVRNDLKRLTRRARDHGLAREMLIALRAIDEALRDNPIEFGDPLFRLRKAQLTVFRRIYRPLDVLYSVHDEKPIVFVRGFQPFPVDLF